MIASESSWPTTHVRHPVHVAFQPSYFSFTRHDIRASREELVASRLEFEPSRSPPPVSQALLIAHREPHHARWTAHRRYRANPDHNSKTEPKQKDVCGASRKRRYRVATGELVGGGGQAVGEVRAAPIDIGIGKVSQAIRESRNGRVAVHARVRQAVRQGVIAVRKLETLAE